MNDLTGLEIRYKINDLCEDLQIEYVKNKFWNINYINNPSEIVQMAALIKNILSLRYIRNLTESAQMYVVNHFNYNDKYDLYTELEVKITYKPAIELYEKLKKMYKVIK
jgi:hypothetical protein